MTGLLIPYAARRIFFFIKHPGIEGSNEQIPCHSLFKKATTVVAPTKELHTIILTEPYATVATYYGWSKAAVFIYEFDNSGFSRKVLNLLGFG